MDVQYVCSIVGGGHLPPENTVACDEFKDYLFTHVERLVAACGVTDFLTAMQPGFDTYAAEAVLRLQARYPVRLHSVLPSEEQAVDWCEPIRERYFDLLARCESEHRMQGAVTPGCLERARRYMIDCAAFVLTDETKLPYAHEREREVIQVRAPHERDGMYSLHVVGA